MVKLRLPASKKKGAAKPHDLLAMRMLFGKRPTHKRKKGRHSRRRKSWRHTVQEWVWPSMGWYNFLRLSEIKVKRNPDTIEKTAKGLAVGVFVSFIPLNGTHLLWIFLFCRMIRGGYVAGLIGSLFGNPWTFPIIWLWSYNLGHFMLGGRHRVEAIPFKFSIEAVLNNFYAFWWDVLWPMFVGGIPTGLLFGFITYYVVVIHVKSYRVARSRFLALRREQYLQNQQHNKN